MWHQLSKYEPSFVNARTLASKTFVKITSLYHVLLVSYQLLALQDINFEVFRDLPIL